VEGRQKNKSLELILSEDGKETKASLTPSYEYIHADDLSESENKSTKNAEAPQFFKQMELQSLPASPRKKLSATKTVVTSELFGSDSDLNRSLEIVYSEPEEDCKKTLSSIYKSSVSTSEKSQSLNKPVSFTHVKRHFVSMSDSPSQSDEQCNSNVSLQTPTSNLEPNLNTNVRSMENFLYVHRGVEDLIENNHDHSKEDPNISGEFNNTRE